MPGRQVLIAEPARIRCHRQPVGTEERPGDEARVQEEAAEQEDPIAEGIEPRKRDVARADLERNHEVEERGRQRHEREKHHRRAVHRKELIERLGAHAEATIRPNQLRTDDERLQPTDQEKAERRPEIEQPDAFMIGGGQPALHFKLWR